MGYWWETDKLEKIFLHALKILKIFSHQSFSCPEISKIREYNSFRKQGVKNLVNS